MKNFLSKIKLYIVTHKVVSVVVFLILIYAGYSIYGKMTSTASIPKYNLAAVSKGTVISVVSGSGQVSTSSQIDLKPTVSGNITYIGVKPGDQVSAGKTLFSLDDTDAQKSVRDAEVNLQSAQLSLDKLKIQNSTDNLNSALSKSYDDGFNNVSNASSDLTTVVNGINTVLGQSNLSDNSVRSSGNTALDYRNKAEALYYQAKNAIDQNQSNFRLLSRNSSNSDIENIINQTYDTTKTLSDLIKDTKDLVDYVAQDTNKQTDFVSTENTLSNYTNTINTDLSNLFSSQTSIKSSQDSIPNSDLDIQNAELSLKQKQNSLQDAKDNLSKYYITAPFDGIMASVPVNVGDSAGSGTTLGTIITSQKLATITLNEVDVAKIKLGEKATLTFDAISDLTIAGTVAEIDSLGTVSQGVVDYTVKISFDTQDDRVKSGMSVSADIITDIAQDVIVVPNGAIKTANNGNSYVQAFDSSVAGTSTPVSGFISTATPKQIIVVTGLADNTSTEITSGLKEGDIIITKTISGTTTKTTTPSLLNAVGGSATKGGGGARFGN